MCLFLTDKLVYDLDGLVQRAHLTIEDIEEYSSLVSTKNI